MYAFGADKWGNPRARLIEERLRARERSAVLTVAPGGRVAAWSEPAGTRLAGVCHCGHRSTRDLPMALLTVVGPLATVVLAKHAYRRTLTGAVGLILLDGLMVTAVALNAVGPA